MLRVSKIPFGVTKLFLIGNSVTFKIPEYSDRRPDRIISALEPSYKKELFNNGISLKSPISAKKGDEYTVAFDEFRRYFGV